MISALQSSTAPIQLMQSAQTASAGGSNAASAASTAQLPQDTVSISAAGRQMSQVSADADSDGDSH